MRYPALVGALALSTTLSTAAHASTITLQPGEATSQDVFIYEFGVPGAFGIPTAARSTNLDTATLSALNPLPAVPFGNFLGSSNTTPLIGANGEVRAHDTKTLIRFDLSGLGLTAEQVGQATINLFAVPGLPPFDNPTAAKPVTTDLRSILQPWSETTVTWENQPTASGVVGSAVQSGVSQWVSFSVTDLVRSWLTNPGLNFGVQLSQPDVLLSDAGKPIASLYLSSNAADPTQRPFLEITTVPEPSTWVLLGSGVVGIGLTARRRSRK